MKKWIKTHPRIHILILGVAFIANAVYGLTTATETWHFAVGIIVLWLWIPLLLWVTGVINKISEWWSKD